MKGLNQPLRAPHHAGMEQPPESVALLVNVPRMLLRVSHPR